jgi:GTP-binding protein
MGDNNFIDYVKIFCCSGKGGAGSAHLYRARGVPKGGPDGGDGGRGGHIVLEGSSQLWTLLHLKYKKHNKAHPGSGGSRNNRHGADGEDVIIKVPLGTQIKNSETEKVVFEITEDRQQKILLSGGRGGLGNSQFKSPTNRTPTNAQPGEDGSEGWFTLELKLLADVGLVGFPNAGKSTLLSVVSAAKPEIANYPFTTLVPNLGVVEHRGFNSFVIADIPGIIEGASEGKGLGHRFLRHIERNSILFFLIPADAKDHLKEFKTLLNELEKYSLELSRKRKILGISKSDMLDNELKLEIEASLPIEIPHIFFSSVTGENIMQMKDILWDSLNS